MVSPTYTFRLSQHGLDLDANGHHSLGWPSACRAATTANITIATALNNGDTLDGVTLATGDRVLVKDQSTGSQNGIYIVGASPARAPDYDTSPEIVGSVVVVSEGTVNADTAWQCTTNAPVTAGTTALVFAAFGGGGGGTPNLEDVLTEGNDTGGTAIISDDPGYDSPSSLALAAHAVLQGHGAAVGDGPGGDAEIMSGGEATIATGADLWMPGGVDGKASNVEIYGGIGLDNDSEGGDVILSPGPGDGTGRDGLIILENLPTSDPGVSGAVWNDSGTLKVS